MGTEDLESPPDASKRVEDATFGGESQEDLRNRSFAGLRVLGCAVVMGILADLLLRAMPWGLNATVWFGALVIAICFLERVHGVKVGPGHKALLVCACVFAAFFVWRDSRMLAVLNLGVVGICLSFAATPVMATGKPLHRAGLFDYGAAGLYAGTQTLGGAIPLLQSDIEWSSIPDAHALGRLKSAGVGIVVAIPLLLVFGVLFVEADAAYERAVKSLFDFGNVNFFIHVLWLVAGAWLAAGFLRLVPRAFKYRQPQDIFIWPESSLGAIEVCLPLFLLDLLFLSFIAVQLQYLFGGHEWVRNATGPTYAEYARRGFFELTLVVSLALPLLLGADWALGGAKRTGKRVFRALAALMLVMLLIITASAMHRMALYLDAYGLTRLRFYTSSFMLWLGVLTVWFGLTVLRDRREPFVFGMFVTGLIMVFALNAANPDACIVRTNLARAEEGKDVDYGYFPSLSSDAIPALFLYKGGDYIPAPRLKSALDKLIYKWGKGTTDLRTWNWSRACARAILRPPAYYEPPNGPIQNKKNAPVPE